ncbi:hypothetical protein KC19_1G102900 [Ceratodon purpureus]|uniref:Uncharacterized protein n=1 Tax=Ceratodon purpureus TaxID=3225 RepID=A0A8T0J6N6_CERPU|nr:hypothetical protein KC19_1G102900 [Ceratodon purpureus]
MEAGLLLWNYYQVGDFITRPAKQDSQSNSGPELVQTFWPSLQSCHKRHDPLRNYSGMKMIQKFRVHIFVRIRFIKTNCFPTPYLINQTVYNQMYQQAYIYEIRGRQTIDHTITLITLSYPWFA